MILEIIKKIGCATTSEVKNSQCNNVYSTDGICFTICAGCHGWAGGYLLVEDEEDESDN